MRTADIISVLLAAVCMLTTVHCQAINFGPALGNLVGIAALGAIGNTFFPGILGGGGGGGAGFGFGGGGGGFTSERVLLSVPSGSFGSGGNFGGSFGNLGFGNPIFIPNRGRYH